MFTRSPSSTNSSLTPQRQAKFDSVLSTVGVQLILYVPNKGTEFKKRKCVLKCDKEDTAFTISVFNKDGSQGSDGKQVVIPFAEVVDVSKHTECSPTSVNADKKIRISSLGRGPVDFEVENTSVCDAISAGLAGCIMTRSPAIAFAKKSDLCSPYAKRDVSCLFALTGGESYFYEALSPQILLSPTTPDADSKPTDKADLIERMETKAFSHSIPEFEASVDIDEDTAHATLPLGESQGDMHGDSSMLQNDDKELYPVEMKEAPLAVENKTNELINRYAESDVSDASSSISDLYVAEDLSVITKTSIEELRPQSSTIRSIDEIENNGKSTTSQNVVNWQDNRIANDSLYMKDSPGISVEDKQLPFAATPAGQKKDNKTKVENGAWNGCGCFFFNTYFR